MGSSSYSYDVFSRSMSAHAAAGTSAFTHDADISSGKTAIAVHPTLDPKLVAGKASPYAGKVMRESRDSADHPDSVAIACIFDVTGSVGDGPRMFIKKLGALMNLIVSKGYLPDPQILFGAVGDETCDRVPLQIGQFESGNEMDASLGNIYIEGGGGGSSEESYELAMYMMARHTSADCWEKRGKKGYLFLVGDEKFRTKVSRGAIERIIGDKVEQDISTEDILSELREHYEVFWIFPNCSQYYTSDITAPFLQKTFDQSFIRLENIEEIAELIAATIGIAEGFNPKDIITDLTDAGLSAAGAKRATSTALATVGSTGALAKKAATVEGALVTGGADSVTRL